MLQNLPKSGLKQRSEKRVMKKILKLAFLIFNLCACTFVFADEYAPKWEKVAPDYVNVQYKKNETFAYNHPALNYLTAITIVGLPISMVSIYKSESINTNNYWYERKQQFDDEIKMCEQIKSNDNRINCYMTVSHNEQNKTMQREQLLLQEEQIRMNNYNARRTQNAINNANRPRTYYNTGNYMYSY